MLHNTVPGAGSLQEKTMATTQVSIRIEQKIKHSAERVFDINGITPTQAVNALYQFVAENNHLPFFIRTEITERLPEEEVQTALIRKISVLQLSVLEFYLTVLDDGEVAEYHRSKLVTECESLMLSLKHALPSFTEEDDPLQPAWSHITGLVNMLHRLLDVRPGTKNGPMKLDHRDIKDGVSQILEYSDALRNTLLPDEKPGYSFTSQLRTFQKQQADGKRSQSDCPDDAWVLVYYLTVEGWDRTLERPQSVKPGCVAFDRAGHCRVATGGNDYDGATHWSPVDISDPNNI